MSFSDNYNALRKKRKEEEKPTPQNTKADIAPLFTNKTTAFFNNDIAPVRTTNKGNKKQEEKKAKAEKDKTEKERKWFQKGAFEDGYQFGDVTKTILGSGVDLLENAGAGIIGMGEKTVDAFATLAPIFSRAQFYQNGGAYQSLETQQMFEKAMDESEKGMSEFVAKDLYDETKVAQKIIFGNANNSVFGEKSDALAQSAGQLGATIGLQAIGVPWFVTTGVTSFGSETENAFNQGATVEEAALSGAISAGAEILTEKISGGIKFGGKALDDALTKQIARGISNKTVRTLTKLGLDMTGEGAEEVLSGAMSALGQKITYADDKELSELFSSEEALESFIGGAVLGGAFGGVNAIKSNAKGVDYASGLTQNEQKVVDKVYQDRVAEEEQSGKITEKQKSKIYDEVLRDMDRGYITTDTIEEILGGETYKTYKDTIDNEDAVTKEYEELGALTNPTLAQQTRYKELHEQMTGIKQNSQRDALKTKLGDEVFGLVKGDRLAESYNERGRRGTAFEADLTKVDSKYQETYKKAAESGILNNTNRTHEFVDMIAKISADKGVLFDFTNNAKLKDSGFAVEGKTVNGFVSKDGVTLNIDSAKALNSVVGHEITHVLEGTEFYDALSQTVIEYAKSRGDYQGRYDTLAALYKNIEGANIDAELTADLVGDYIFNDTDFVNNLSTNNRNVFEKIYDEIKYMLKVATAGSKQARELEKVKRTFEQAYKAEGKAQTNTKYSIGEIIDENQKSYGIGVHLDSTLLDNLTPDERKEMVKERIKELGGEVFTAYDNNGNAVNISIAKPEARFKNQNGRSVPVNKDLTGKFIGNETKQEAVVLADELIVTAKYDDSKAPAYPHGWLDNNGQNNWEYWTTYIQDKNNTIWKATLNIATSANGEKILYDINPIRKAGQSVKSDTSLLDDNVAQTGEKVKQYSLSEDSEGRKLSPAVAKRFANSKAVDENGNLKVVYHGTYNGEFSIFDKSKGFVEDDYGSGFYFSDNEADVSDHYEGGGPDFDNKVGRRADEIWNEEPDIEYEEAEQRAREELFKGSHKFEVYLNIENPAIVGETVLLDGEEYLAEYDEADYEDYDDYIADVEQLVADKIDEIVWDVERKVDFYDSGRELDNIRNVLFDAYAEGGIGLEELKKKINDLYLENEEGELVGNEVTRQIIESLGYDGIVDPTVSGKWNMDIEEGTTHYIVFKPNQIKSVTNENPTDNPDIHRSLSNKGDKQTGRGIYGKDIALESALETEVAPTRETLFPDDRTSEEVYRLRNRIDELDADIIKAMEAQDMEAYEKAYDEWQAVKDRIAEIEPYSDSERIASLDDADVPPEAEAPFRGMGDTIKLPKTTVSTIAKNVRSSLGLRNNQMQDVRKLIEDYSMQEFPSAEQLFRAVKDKFGTAPEMYEDVEINEVKRFLRSYRINVSKAVRDGTTDYADFRKRNFGKILFSKSGLPVDTAYQELNDMYPGLFPEDIINPADQLERIAEVANMQATKARERRIDDETLWNVTDDIIDSVNDYQQMQREKSANKDYRASLKRPLADDIAPVSEDAAPVKETVAKNETVAPVKETKKQKGKVADVLTDEPEIKKKDLGFMAKVRNDVLDKGMVFEKLSLESGNRELQAKWNSIRYAEAKAQYFMENGNAATSSLKSIRETVEKSGKTKEFYEYLYHRHNVDRMNLEERYDDVQNKPVFGYDVTSQMSNEIASQLEANNPEFKEWANTVYAYNKHLRNMLVESGVISAETAKRWQEMYPHYVPVRRVGDEGVNINVALDTRRTGVNAPVKQATGGNRNILPLFDTMAMRTEQTYKAIAKNRFGVELKDLIGTTVENDVEAGEVDLDELVGKHEELLQEGKDGNNPTFTVFENGERVKFEIDEEMYDAMRPTSNRLSYTNKALYTANNIRRGLLTEYNPVFMLTNPIKDAQDVLINSQHSVKTYAHFPKAVAELIGKKGHWYKEYMENGGEHNSYFDSETKTFEKEKSALGKVVGFPFEKISDANNFIERIPRLAEYIASRKEGRSIDVSMLDAARVTTNFAAGGDLTKMLNRNGVTFLNASVQGAIQQVRNVREAKAEGIKGWAKLTAKVALAGLPSILVNHLLWDDDEEYAELSDYVKQNYYIVAKYGDGNFVRIPKGRALAVIQDAFEQMENLITGNDEVDLKAFGELVVTNLAPNNPLDNNIFAPIAQTIKNKTWYGEELVPTRLQDLPAKEQFDESTDAVSKWLGEKLNISPYKINYLLDQYSGGIGDAFLPMMTPKAESGNSSFFGDMLAPLRDKFTTNSIINNQNVSDFYDTKDELIVNANASGATDEDVLMSKYMNSRNAELSELYAKKREIQNSNLADDVKYSLILETQEKINAIASDSLSGYGDVNINGEYANIGDKYFKLNKEGEWVTLSDDEATKYKVTSAAGDAPYATNGKVHYRWYEPEEGSDTEAGWRKITDSELEKQNEITSALGITPVEYWGNKKEYDYAYKNPENYAVAKAVGGYEAYTGYSSELYDIKADKDKYGQSISGSRKTKVLDYINNLDADYYTKIILWKSEYNSDDTYNNEIIEYLNGREDISYKEMEAILIKLGFKVDSDGNIYW